MTFFDDEDEEDWTCEKVDPWDLIEALETQVAFLQKENDKLQRESDKYLQKWVAAQELASIHMIKFFLAKGSLGIEG